MVPIKILNGIFPEPVYLLKIILEVINCADKINIA